MSLNTELIPEIANCVSEKKKGNKGPFIVNLEKIQYSKQDLIEQEMIKIAADLGIKFESLVGLTAANGITLFGIFS